MHSVLKKIIEIFVLKKFRTKKMRVKRVAAKKILYEKYGQDIRYKKSKH